MKIKSGNSSLWTRETYVNRTSNRIWNSEIHETLTSDTNKLYRTMQTKHGRCIGKVYMDTDNKAQHVGWCFMKRVKYVDCDDTHIQETWISVHESFPFKTFEYRYETVAQHRKGKHNG